VTARQSSVKVFKYAQCNHLILLPVFLKLCASVPNDIIIVSGSKVAPSRGKPGKRACETPKPGSQSPDSLLSKFIATANTCNSFTALYVGSTSTNIYSNITRHHLLLVCVFFIISDRKNGNHV
jgi:hypothetical protein